VGEGPVFVVGPLVHAGLARLRGWETVLWASDATWVIGLACYVGEGPVGLAMLRGVLRLFDA
jgi:hypothetical protein